MDIQTIIVLTLFALTVIAVVALEVRTTKRINAFIKPKKVRTSEVKTDDAQMIVNMFLEWLRSNPEQLKAELKYMQEVMSDVTLENHTH